MNVERINLVQLTHRFTAPIDLFICSSSYESRCLSVAGALNPKVVRKALILKAVDFESYVGVTADALVKRFGSDSSIIPVDTRDPLFSADNIAKALLDALADMQGSNLLVDVTTFTHETLMVLLRLLQRPVGPFQGFTFIMGQRY